MKSVEQFVNGVIGAAMGMCSPAVTPPVVSGCRGVGTNGETPSEKPEVYQVWHDNHWPGSRARHVIGCPPSPFPQGFTHVANVRANNLEQAFGLTKDKGSMAAGAESWQPWEENPEVEVLVMPRRSTSADDVIVDPKRKEHRVVTEGFDYWEACQGGKYTLFEIIAVMAKARK